MRDWINQVLWRAGVQQNCLSATRSAGAHQAMRFRTEEKLVESLHFILDAFAAAVRTGDANDVDLLFQMTKAKTGLMDDIRHSLQTGKVPADAEYQRRLLELTAQFERSVWLLRRQMGFFSRRYRQ